ncbi:hypothetical protein SEA_KLEIN_201 [Mycobacterium phage Klein]|nr:hypothetical protein SEA_KLEIN_201 [Mycobacterium phage Klein]
MTDPNICQHHFVDNETWKCEACGNQMIEQSIESETVLTAPNLAAGTGVYVPDRTRQREVIVGYTVRYICERCEYDGDFFSSNGDYVVSCGQDHEGDYILVRGAS